MIVYKEAENALGSLRSYSLTKHESRWQRRTERRRGSSEATVENVEEPFVLFVCSFYTDSPF